MLDISEALLNGNGPKKDPTALYRLYGPAGCLLYVGIASKVDRRLSQHRRGTPWWYLVDESRIEVEWFRNRGRARTREARAIREEKPVFNIRP